jgi:hypothetical protein
VKASDIKVLELRDYDGLKVYQAFNSLLLGMKMLPMYQELSFEEWVNLIDLMPEDKQENVIRMGAQFVVLENEDIRSIISFCCDPNSVPYSKENIKNLNPLELIECVVAVSMKIIRFKVDFLSDSEKKKSLITQ